MPRREGTAAGAAGERPGSVRTLRRAGPNWRSIGIGVMAALAAAPLAMVASAERDAYLRTHPPVPTLVGRTVATAARMMVPLHFGILVTGSRLDPTAPEGVILIQNPPPGRLMPAGTVIQVKVSQGSGIVPHLRGIPVQEAARRLERIGLRLGRVEAIADDTAPGTVLEQFTPPGHQLEANSAVAVMVSNGPDPAASGPLPPLVPDGAPLVPAAPFDTAPAVGGAPRMPPDLRRPEDAPAPDSGPAETSIPGTATPR
jgi:PASTA domain